MELSESMTGFINADNQLCQTALLEFQVIAKKDPSLFNMVELAKCVDKHCDKPGLFQRVDGKERVGKFYGNHGSFHCSLYVRWRSTGICGTERQRAYHWR